jgi:hypothetical protein
MNKDITVTLPKEEYDRLTSIESNTTSSKHHLYLLLQEAYRQNKRDLGENMDLKKEIVKLKRKLNHKKAWYKKIFNG